MHTGNPAARNGRARSTARGNWLDCTPTIAISAPPPWPTHRADDAIGPDPLIGLVERVEANCGVGPEHPATPGVFRQRVEAGERVRRDRRLDPLDRVAVIVVMARLDQDQVKAARTEFAFLRHVDSQRSTRGTTLQGCYRHAKAKDRPRSRPGRSAPQTEAAFRRHLGDILSDIDLLPIPSAAGEAPEGLCSTGDPNLNAMRTLAWTPCVTLPFGAGRTGWRSACSSWARAFGTKLCSPPPGVSPVFRPSTRSPRAARSADRRNLSVSGEADRSAPIPAIRRSTIELS